MPNLYLRHEIKMYGLGLQEVRLCGEASREKIKHVCTRSWKYDVRKDW